MATTAVAHSLMGLSYDPTEVVALYEAWTKNTKAASAELLDLMRRGEEFVPASVLRGKASVEAKRKAGTLADFHSAGGKASTNVVKKYNEENDCSTPRFEVFGSNCTPEGELVDNEGVVVKTLGQVLKVLKLPPAALDKQKILRDRGAGYKLVGGWCWIRKDDRLTKTFGNHKICIQPKDEWTWPGK